MVLGQRLGKAAVRAGGSGGQSPGPPEPGPLGTFSRAGAEGLLGREGIVGAAPVDAGASRGCDTLARLLRQEGLFLQNRFFFTQLSISFWGPFFPLPRPVPASMASPLQRTQN